MKLSSGAVILTLALAAGCQSTGPQNPPPSGFLGDYSQLKPAPDREGVALYIDKSADYRPYTKVMFDPPVQVLVTPNPQQPPVPQDVLARIGQQFQESLRHALEPTYQVVNTPGPDVLRVRAAITGLQPAKPPAGAIDYLPFKAIYNVGREAAGGGPRVAEMTAEMEVLDPNGKRLVAATSTRKGDKTLPQGDQITWESLQSINNYWAKGFRMRLDELRGIPPTAGK
jgi:hypothetical protein